jgi:hypothetical protein
MWSPDDPLFFVHHSNVDRIWALWQDYVDHDLDDPSEFRTPFHYEGRGIDRPMPFPSLSDVGWDFRLGGDFPTPRDVISNDDNIQVRYIDDQLARTLRYTPNPRWFEQAPSGDMGNSCDRNRRNERALKLGGGRLKNHQEGTVEEMIDSTSLRGNRYSNDLLSNLKNDLQQKYQDEINVSDVTSFSDDESSNITSISDCLNMNTFTNIDERTLWDDLCHDLPLTTTYPERLAALAQSECQKRGNPFSANVDWIERMNMRNELIAFECFHLPDRKHD